MHFNELIGDFRAARYGTAFLFEADYSAQMCADLMTGAEDFAIIFSPRATTTTCTSRRWARSPI